MEPLLTEARRDPLPQLRMKLVLLHVSDIHLKTGDDPMMARSERVVQAVRGIAQEIDVCLVAVSGDIAFSGTDEQYLAALDLLSRIQDGLREELKPKAPVELFMVPGNHDCDFRAGGDARDILIERITRSEASHVSTDVARVCTEVQKQFFALRDIFAPGSLVGDDPLYWEYHVEFGGARVLCRCCNTAWASQLSERPGTLYYPTDRVRDQAGKVDLAITMFHHPYNWQMPLRGRAFQKKVEEVSDIVLTGHEHDATNRTQRGSRGEVNVYLEGGALQENRNPNESEFNVILVDTSTRRQKVYHFSWAIDIYAATPTDPSWEEYQVNRLRSSRQLQLSDEMSLFLGDLGISLAHPVRGPLALADIFVYPDLKEVVYRPRDVSHTVRGETLVELASRVERLLITAAAEAGKTTLAKQLFQDYFASGFVPVFLSGRTGRFFGDDRAVAEFGKLFTEQYVGMSFEQYRQLDRSRRVFIVDDFDRIKRTKATSLRSVISQMTQFAGHVILLANDIAQQVAEIAGNAPLTEGHAAFAQYHIQPFGHLRRTELIERWFALDESGLDDQGELARRIVQAKETMDTAIGRNFVPSYPVMLLPILQALQHDEPINTNASTYGYFYELLIRRDLAAGATSVGLDVKLGYLTFLAQSMFFAGGLELTEAQLRDVHAAYEQHHLLRVPFRELIESLTQSQVLGERQGRYSFRYAYQYYYFVASYLRDHLTEAVVQKTLTDLARRVHEEANANILLFLAHLSKDRFVVDRMIETAGGLFADVPRADLQAKTSPLLSIEGSVPSIYIENDSRENRRAIMKERDEFEEKLQSKVGASATDGPSPMLRDETRTAIDRELAEIDTFGQQLGVAFRTLQILGQFLKNFVGTMDGETKRVLADNCIALGLRTLGALFRLVEQRGKDYMDTMAELLRQEDPGTADRDLAARAKQSLSGLVTLASYGMIKRVSHAIGSPHLGWLYDLLRRDDGTPAVGLIHVSLQLDEFSGFPEREVEGLYREIAGNHLAAQVLRGLVLHHFHMFDLRFDLKQRVCAVLEVQYKSSLGTDARQKLIRS